MEAKKKTPAKASPKAAKKATAPKPRTAREFLDAMQRSAREARRIRAEMERGLEMLSAEGRAALGRWSEAEQEANGGPVFSDAYDQTICALAFLGRIADGKEFPTRRKAQRARKG